MPVCVCMCERSDNDEVRLGSTSVQGIDYSYSSSHTLWIEQTATWSWVCRSYWASKEGEVRGKEVISGKRENKVGGGKSNERRKDNFFIHLNVGHWVGRERPDFLSAWPKPLQEIQNNRFRTCLVEGPHPGPYWGPSNLYSWVPISEDWQPNLLTCLRVFTLSWMGLGNPTKVSVSLWTQDT